MTEEQKKLVEENHNLIYSFLQKYGLTIDDCYDLAAIGLCKAAKAFDENISAFSTYAYKCMFTTVYAEKRKCRTLKAIPDIKLSYYDDQSKYSDNRFDDYTYSFISLFPSKDNVESEVLSEIIFNDYCSTIRYKDKLVLELFRTGHTQMEISKIVGISQPQISRIRKKFIHYLRDKNS